MHGLEPVLTAPTISHHLKVLKETGLVTAERRGTWVYYRVEQAALNLLSTVLSVPEAVDA